MAEEQQQNTVSPPAKIRVGNDIDIRWSLVDGDGNPYNLEGRNVSVEIEIGGKKRHRIRELEVSANVLHFVYYGKDQKYTGGCDLKFIENDGEREMVTFDTREAFILVPHSWQAVDPDEQPERIYLEYQTVTSSLTERVGPKGDTGDPAGFGTVTADVDANVGTPSVSVETDGPDTAKNFHFTFRNIKGETGAQGQQGIQGEQGIQGIQGIQGEKGDAAFFAVSGTKLVVSAYNATVENQTLKIL